MVTNSYSVHVSYKVISANEDWRGVMDKGQGPTEVTGGSIDLPQGGTRESRAAATGGQYNAAAEIGSQAEENGKQIINSSMQDVITPIIVYMIQGESGGIHEVEFFLTNVMKNEYIKTAAEFSDNPDEAEATQQVIDSIQVVVEVSGLPSIEDIKQWAVQKVQEVLGGVSQ